MALGAGTAQPQTNGRFAAPGHKPVRRHLQDGHAGVALRVSEPPTRTRRRPQAASGRQMASSALRRNRRVESRCVLSDWDGAVSVSSDRIEEIARGETAWLRTRLLPEPPHVSLTPTRGDYDLNPEFRPDVERKLAPAAVLLPIIAR